MRFPIFKSVSPERAYALFSAQAFCYLKTKSPDQARANAEKAKQYAKTPAEQRRICSLLRAADGDEQAGSGKVSDTELMGAYADRPSIMKSRNDDLPKDDLPRDVPSVMRRGEIRHVEAVTKILDCDGKNRRLHVMVEAKEMIFEFDDPANVAIRNAHGSALDLQCGKQEPVNLGIFYAPATPPATADGMIRELVF